MRLAEIIREDVARDRSELVCAWKLVRLANLRGEGTSFAGRDYLACDDCDGHDYASRCYTKNEAYNFDV